MGTEQRCGDCRHWGAAEEAARGERFRVCQAIRHSGHVAFYARFAGESMAANHPESKAGTMDGSGFASCLVAREDFGCRLWGPKS